MKTVFKTEKGDLEKEENAERRANSVILSIYAVNVIYAVLLQCIHISQFYYWNDEWRIWQKAWIN